MENASQLRVVFYWIKLALSVSQWMTGYTCKLKEQVICEFSVKTYKSDGYIPQSLRVFYKLIEMPSKLVDGLVVIYFRDKAQSQ